MYETQRSGDAPASATTTQRRTGPLLRLLLVVAALVVFAAGCGNGAETSAAGDTATDAAESAPFRGDDAADERSGSFAASADRAEAEMAQDAEAPQVPSVEATVAAGLANGEATAQLPDFGRDIIYTARLELASTDVSSATREAIRAIEARGGFLFSQETSGGAGGTSVLTFKVTPDQFQAALNDLGSVGTVRSQSISADDVTAIVVDLESRINTAAASVERLRKLLDDADRLEVIASLENQLLQRETSLEQLRGQLRTVQNQVDLATITVTVVELLNRPSLALAVASYAGHDGGFGCFDSPSVRTGDADDPMTICYRLTNTGDTPLADLMIDDPALGAEVDDMLVVDGVVTQIDPGEVVTLAYEFELESSVRVRTSASAIALDDDGNPIGEPVGATAATVRFDVAEEEGVPSFGETLGNSWNALVTIALALALIVVATAPFAAVLIVLGVVLRFVLRQLRVGERVASRRPAPPNPPTSSGPPPPPGAPGPSTPRNPAPDTPGPDDRADSDSETDGSTVAAAVS